MSPLFVLYRVILDARTPLGFFKLRNPQLRSTSFFSSSVLPRAICVFLVTVVVTPRRATIPAVTQILTGPFLVLVLDIVLLPLNCWSPLLPLSWTFARVLFSTGTLGDDMPELTTLDTLVGMIGDQYLVLPVRTFGCP